MSICDNCLTPLDEYEDAYHRCMADENSCVEGKDCPYYVETCDCNECGGEQFMSEFMTCHWCGASEEWEPCHSSGTPMEPTIKSGWEGWYRCMNCTHIQGDDALLHDPNTIIYTPMGKERS